MEYLHSDISLDRDLFTLGNNLSKLVDFFEQSNVYEFIQKLLPGDLVSFLQNKEITISELFDQQRISCIVDKIPNKSKFIFSNIIWVIDNLISDLAFVLRRPSAI